MDHAVVLDANVVAKAFLDEEYSDLATAMIADSTAMGRPFFAPFHFQSEVINTIHKHRRDGDILMSTLWHPLSCARGLLNLPMSAN